MSELLYTIIAIFSILILVSLGLIYYRYKITKFERKYFKLFGYYPSYFIIQSNEFNNMYSYKTRQQILNYEEKVNYDKDENCNLVLEIDCDNDCCNSCCDFGTSVCCISSCVCCKENSPSVVSNLFNYKHVMSTNFTDNQVLNLIENYKQKLNNLVLETQKNEWTINEISDKLENKDDIMDIINQDKEELESKLETDPLNTLKDLANVYKREKMNRTMTCDLEKKINILVNVNIGNKREIYIYREKINELYKYTAMCSLVE
jgi:hypothetical protein